MTSRKAIYQFYDDSVDALIVMFVDPKSVETVVHYMSGDIGIIYNEHNSEIVGFQIEGYSRGRSHKWIGKCNEWIMELWN